jgi:hypothetical protein
MDFKLNVKNGRIFREEREKLKKEFLESVFIPFKMV